jgi:hypothetical protein
MSIQSPVHIIGLDKASIESHLSVKYFIMEFGNRGG